jgi:tetratricopeptide (TPR) repeat protein
VRAALILLIVLAGATAHATPSEDLDQAKSAYRSGQYTRALPLLNALLYPPPPKLARSTDLADAYLALGVCRYETGDMPGAKREFDQALAVNSDVRIDPLIVSDQTAIDAFNQTRLDREQRTAAENERKRRADLRKLRESIIGFESHPLYLNFVPFGVGQFQNKQDAKGAFFAATEGVTLIGSVSIWLYLVNTYGVRSTRVPSDDASTVFRLQQIEIGTGFAFLGLWVLGAVDSYLNYKPQTRAEIDDSLLPIELRDLDKPAPKKRRPPKTSFHVLPMLVPNGAGIGLAWEN